MRNEINEGKEGGKVERWKGEKVVEEERQASCLTGAEE